jgi:hypothetical protein
MLQVQAARVAAGAEGTDRHLTSTTALAWRTTTAQGSLCFRGIAEPQAHFAKFVDRGDDSSEWITSQAKCSSLCPRWIVVNWGLKE